MLLELKEPMMTRLTDHQRTALTIAASTPGSLLQSDAIEREGIAKRALTALVRRGLLEERRDAGGEGEGTLLGYAITESGRAAIGSKAGAASASTQADAAPSPRATKQETVLALLKQTEGVSLTEITEATGWQQHSVRGFLSGTVKKKLGLEVLSERSEARGRVYRVTEARA